MPIKYYISLEQNVDTLKQEWTQRHELRQVIDADRKHKDWDSRLLPGSAELPPERRFKQATDAQEEEGDQVGEHVDSWDTIIPLAANISGGGVRITTHLRFESGDYVLLEILVPMPRRIVDIVARVITANSNFVDGEDREYYNTGLQFVFIDERDRDAIVNHISNVQLKRIRQLREQFIFRDGVPDAVEEQETSLFNWAGLGKWLGFTLIFLTITILIFNYFRHYAKDHPKNEIEEIFEGGSGSTWNSSSSPESVTPPSLRWSGRPLPWRFKSLRPSCGGPTG